MRRRPRAELAGTCGGILAAGRDCSQDGTPCGVGAAWPLGAEMIGLGERWSPGSRDGAGVGTAGEDDPRVGLSELAAVHEYGLAAGLGGAGMSAVSLPGPGNVVAFARLAGRRALVVPAERLRGVVGALAAFPLLALVLVLSGVSPSGHVEALRAPAAGVVTADADLPQAVAVVRAALAGQTPLPAEMAQELSRAGATREPPPRIEARERVWPDALAKGGTVAELARRSGYREREMYRLLASVYRRLGVTTRTGAVLQAERHGLLAVDDVRTGPRPESAGAGSGPRAGPA